VNEEVFDSELVNVADFRKTNKHLTNSVELKPVGQRMNS